MTGSFERDLAAWLQSDGPSDVPGAVIDRALTATQTTTQRGRPALAGLGLAGWPLGRLPSGAAATLSRSRPLLLVAALLIVAMVGAVLISSRPQPRPAPLLAWTSFERGGGVFHRVDLAGTVVSSLLLTAAGCPVLLPDGQRMAYSHGATWSIRELERGRTSAIPGSGGFDPFWAARSPDRWRVIDRNGMLVDFQAGSVSHAEAISGASVWVAWTPDGEVSYALLEGGEAVIRVLDETGSVGEVTRYPWDEAQFGLPNFAWSPDGRTIVHFASSAVPSAEFVDTETGRVTTLPNLLPTQLAPSQQLERVGWSPDGSRVALQDPEGDIVIADPDGTDQVTIGIDGEVRAFPTWSPDGEWIAIGTDAELVTVHPDGTGRVSRPPLEGWGPLLWSDDSRELAVRSIDAAGDVRIDILVPDRVGPLRSSTLPIPDEHTVSSFPGEQCLTWAPEAQ